MSATGTVPYEPFTPERYLMQTPRTVTLIEGQFNAEEAQPQYPKTLHQPYVVQFQTPTTLPISINPISIVLIVGLLGFFTISLLAFLAYLKK